MARRPLPRILSNGTAQIAKSRELARTAADSATDVLHPLITVTRGLRRLAAAGRRKWRKKRHKHQQGDGKDNRNGKEKGDAKGKHKCTAEPVTVNGQPGFRAFD